MNCAESQDLLLDFAYGELEPARAAEVEAHVAGCAACRAEKAQLDQARKMVAPLRELEEPSEKFDEPILRAARAEAGMQADGTPGPVVEVTASVKPLGLQAARLDPHARVHGDARKPRWWKRPAAVAGSAAAAAAVAAVVSVSVTKQQRQLAHEEVAPITVRAPQPVVPQALDDALKKNAKEDATGDASAAAGGHARAVQPPPPSASAAPAQEAEPKKMLRHLMPPEQRPASPAKEAPRPDARKDKVVERDTARAEQQAPAGAPSMAAPPVAPSAARARASAAPPPAPAASAPTSDGALGASARPASSAGPTASADDVRPVADAATSPPAATLGGAAGGKMSAQRKPETAVRSADQVEEDASAARRAGDYARAAVLYKDAAAMRKDSTPDRAAWDMAHAVECLAAGGNVPDAIAARKELLRTFPDQQGPRAAADAALRSVPLPRDENGAAPK